MLGQFYWDLEKLTVNKEKSLEWLNSSGLKGETGSLITAAKDQSLIACYH